MVGGSANGLNDPNRLTSARILPSQFTPHLEFVIDEVFRCEVAAGLQANHLVALLTKLVGQSSPTGSRTNHHDDGRVIQFIFGSHCR